jgi:F420-dependent oxidoreductase-like protein
LTVLAAAAVRTTTIRLGTAIVPTYPRHPLALAQQALALGDLAPERLRLGVGPSHRPFIEGIYGLPMPSPLAHLREYVTVLRAALWQGQVDYQGRFFRVQVSLPRTPRTPILISALGEKAFHLAGELADGAISWMCPVPYLLEQALPALQAGAAKSGRPTPPLVAHLPVALGQDRQAIRAAARQQLGGYRQFPFYVQMFAEAGFPVASDGTMSDALLDSLVVFGDEAIIAARLTDLLAQGLDEVHVKPLLMARPEDEQARLARLLRQL